VESAFDTKFGWPSSNTSTILWHFSEIWSVGLEIRAKILLYTRHRNFPLAWVHTAGASIRLSSRHASEEHEDLLDRPRLVALAKGCGLIPAGYRRFLFGANQVAVRQRNGDLL